MEDQLYVREANTSDLDQIRRLFYETITTVNVRDYDPDQIRVWSASSSNVDRWKNKLEVQFFLVACIANMVVGFGSLTDEGYLDFMFVHKDHQGQGIASVLLTELETRARRIGLGKIYADVSITARPFFAKRGFDIIDRYNKTIEGISFANAVMQKLLAEAPDARTMP